MNNKPVAPSNEALIKPGNKPNFVVPFRIIILLFGTEGKQLSVYSKTNHDTFFVRLLENRFESNVWEISNTRICALITVSL